MLSWIKKLTSRPEEAPRSNRRRLDLSQADFSSIYAVGDIHGRLDLLKEVEERIADDLPENGNGLVVYLGDYVDRGPNSAGVLQHLCEYRPSRFQRICLCGNHDDTMLQFLDAPLSHRDWLEFGGRETLLSYGINAEYLLELDKTGGHLKDALQAKIPAAHVEFLKNTPVSLKMEDLFFVHAGIQPGVPIDEQDDLDMMWIREPFLSEGPLLPIMVIHGHTPSDTISYGMSRIGLDTFAYASGKLTVMRFCGETRQEL